MRVVVTDPVSEDCSQEREILAEAGADLELAAGDREEVLATCRFADGLLNTFFRLGAAEIETLRSCRVIARYGIGVDNIDLAAAARHGIVVTNVPDYCVEEVATHSLALLLSLLRRIPEADAALRRGVWGIGDLEAISRPSSLVVGVVGLGRIGSRVAGLLGAFGISVLGCDPYLDQVPAGVERVSLDELLARADAVTLHTPLTEETRGLIGEAELAQMRPHAVLVNTARGPIVEFAPLRAALFDGRLRAAALDVFEEEPPDPGALGEVPGLLLTPHLAFYSREALRESQAKAARQVARVLSGATPDYPVALPGAG